MITEKEYPILEFDDNRDALLNPTAFVDKPLCKDKMIITFFPEVIDKLSTEGKIGSEKQTV